MLPARAARDERRLPFLGANDRCCCNRDDARAFVTDWPRAWLRAVTAALLVCVCCIVCARARPQRVVQARYSLFPHTRRR
jgi:hypothetical protein